jgi:hypothetical protein
MVMIVKKHEKKWRGFISVTRDRRFAGPACGKSPARRSRPGELARPPDAGQGTGGAPRRAQLAAERWPRPRAQERKARTFALLVHCTEQ